jgi:murein DD-endopeptidase MepM/ murein hydrolase activator NlpD
VRSSARALLVTPFLTALGCAPAPATNCPEPAPVVASPEPVATEATPAAEKSAAKATAASVVAEVVAAINAGDAEALFARFSPEMQRAAPLPSLEAMLEGMVVQRGLLTGVRPIAATDRQGTFHVEAERGAWKLQIVVDGAGTIVGLLLTEPDDAPPPVARSAPLGLPFRGEWLVFWGGDKAELNHHVEHPSQRRAADLVIVDATGKTHRGDGKALKDYFAYGQDVLAMADGVVVTVVDGVPDNPPGELNPYFAPGNMVVLRHEGELYSVYAHLSPGSVKVKVGDKVRRGRSLGACGNSGNSSEPHLHVQLQDGPRFEKSWGVEAVFDEVKLVRDGAEARQAGYVFQKGDRVAPVK